MFGNQGEGVFDRFWFVKPWGFNLYGLCSLIVVVVESVFVSLCRVFVPFESFIEKRSRILSLIAGCTTAPLG